MAKILIIEDDARLRELYGGKFIDEGYEVVHAVTGKEGLSIVEKDKPDLIVLDIMLPGGLNGFDVLEILKKDKYKRKIPVIILTNLDTEQKVAKEIGAESYVVKAHTDPKDIVEIVKKYIE